jgi:hypothetical protein
LIADNDTGDKYRQQQHWQLFIAGNSDTGNETVAT